MNIHISEYETLSKTILRSTDHIFKTGSTIVFLNDDIMLASFIRRRYNNNIVQALNNVSGISNNYPLINKPYTSGVGRAPAPSDLIIVFDEFNGSEGQVNLIGHYNNYNSILSVVSMYGIDSFDDYFIDIPYYTLFYTAVD